MRAWLPGPADRHRRGAAGLRPADQGHSDDRGRPSDPRCRRARSRRAGARSSPTGAGPDDLVLVLLSGGASANWIAPVEGLSLADKQAVTRALLRSGANIGEINTVRKHLSRIKGGRLARLAQPARVVTLAISDVPGDDPAVIGSGPTVPDPTTLADARAIVARFKLELPGVRDAGARRSEPTSRPKPGDAAFAATEFKLIARPADAFRAAEQAVRGGGLRMRHARRPDRRRGPRRRRRPRRPARWRCKRQGRRAVILSGGELTVTIRGQGRGGPNQEYALALALALARRARHRGAGRRYRRHRRRRGLRGRPGRRRDRPEHAARARCARPRSGPFSLGQQFHRVFHPAGRPGRNRPDLDQRERFSRHRR